MVLHSTVACPILLAAKRLQDVGLPPDRMPDHWCVALQVVRVHEEEVRDGKEQYPTED